MSELLLGVIVGAAIGLIAMFLGVLVNHWLTLPEPPHA